MTEPFDSVDHAVSPDGPRRPSLLVFDVNETLSDMAPISERFADVGAPSHLASTWFAGLLRDGFSLTVGETSEKFAVLAAEGLRVTFGELRLSTDLDDAVEHVMGGWAELDVHPDVPDGIRALSDLDIRMVTLSNGATSVAEGLLERAGLRDLFADVLSVEDGGIWKPAPRAYAYALERCQVDPMDAVLVAVHPWDTDGAHRAGLGNAWINRSGGRFPTYFTAPDVEATSLVDLAHKLR